MQVQVQDVGFGYSPFPHELSRDSGVSLQAKGLFAVYGSFVSATNPSAWPSSQYICKLCGVNEKTFWKYKRELLHHGWISEQQQHKENGQYSTMLVTRYYHPSMNPHFSTVHQKTEHRKTEHPKTAVKQETEKPITKKHTQTRSCVSGDITKDQRECIEWTIQEMTRRGILKNEVALRCHLVKEASKGLLMMDDYRKHRDALKRAEKVKDEALSKVAGWERESKDDPVDWDEQKKLYPALFR